MSWAHHYFTTKVCEMSEVEFLPEPLSPDEEDLQRALARALVLLPPPAHRWPTQAASTRCRPERVAGMRRRIFGEFDGTDLRTCAAMLSCMSKDRSGEKFHGSNHP